MSEKRFVVIDNRSTYELRWLVVDLLTRQVAKRSDYQNDALELAELLNRTTEGMK